LAESADVDGPFFAPEGSGVPDSIEPAKSSRASCRGCARNIARGELRFGESLPNLFAEGETHVWFHLVCAACMRPEKLGPALDVTIHPVAERDWLQETVAAGLAHPRLQRLLRAERAPSGAAHCRQCHELIAKGAWRLALQMFEEGRMRPIGSIHLECSGTYFGTAEIMGRIERLTESLSPPELADIEQRCR
jgi:hypothetical protein